MTMLAAPVKFGATGGFVWRTFLLLSYMLGGYCTLWLEERSGKVAGIFRADSRAGLSLRHFPRALQPYWRIDGFWARPIGAGHGRDVLMAVLGVADALESTLVLRADNRRLAEDYYAPLGFVVRPGDEDAHRPWMTRCPQVPPIPLPRCSNPLCCDVEAEPAELVGIA